MKVKDLIEKLQGYDGEMEVLHGSVDRMWDRVLSEVTINEIEVTRRCKKVGNKILDCEYEVSSGSGDKCVVLMK